MESTDLQIARSLASIAILVALGTTKTGGRIAMLALLERTNLSAALLAPRTASIAQLETTAQRRPRAAWHAGLARTQTNHGRSVARIVLSAPMARLLGQPHQKTARNAPPGHTVN